MEAAEAAADEEPRALNLAQSEAEYDDSTQVWHDREALESGHRRG